jgi:predicted Zn finger-like uncharacterized protein
MDVRCERCSTDYDFDDALISERGTTVKCTQCGHQFRVYPRTAIGLPERWVVRASGGREQVFSSLKELQRAIAQGQVSADDYLSRGSQAARRLASIAELEPFFGVVPTEEKKPITLHGVAPPAKGGADPSKREPIAAPRVEPAPQNDFSLGATAVASPSMAFGKTLPTAPDLARPPADAAIAATERLPERGPATERVLTSALPQQPASAVDEQRTRGGSRTVLGLGQAPVAQSKSPVAGEPPASPAPGMLYVGQAFGAAPRPMDMNATLRVAERPPLEPGRAHPPVQEPDIAVVSPTSAPGVPSSEIPRARAAADEPIPGVPRRARSRWVFAAVGLGCVVLVGAALGRQYLARSVDSTASAEPAADPRVDALLGESSRLLREGDTEGAKEQLDKASVLAERDPRLLAALAHLEALRADTAWLRHRLAPDADERLKRSTQRALEERLQRAEAALAKATAASGSSSDVERSRVDLWRMKSELEKARSELGKIAAQPTEPGNAYVLAMLDLADATPPWPSIIERLALASGAEHSLGRARSAFVYALSASGQPERAESELEKLDPGHPLFSELTLFVRARRAAGEAAIALGDAGTPEKDAGSAAPVAERVAAAKPAEREAGEPVIKHGDFRAHLEYGSRALRAGNLDAAERSYRTTLDIQPGNTEALSGLGDVARRRGDSMRAAEYYDRVLAQNPSYLPALIGSADIKWGLGDRQGALKLYRRILEQAGTGTSYGQRAADRIQQAEGAPAERTPEGSAASPPAGDTESVE